MKITRISIYRKDLTYVGGQYAWGRGNVIEVGKSTIVNIETDSGQSGVGEFCPCGENYMDAHSEGTEAAARILAPALLGEDPRQLAHIERLMDNTITTSKQSAFPDLKPVTANCSQPIRPALASSPTSILSATP